MVLREEERKMNNKKLLSGKTVSTILSPCLIVAIFFLLVAAPQTGRSFAPLASVQGAPQTFVEDFTSDTNPAMGGFASSRFVHTTSGNFTFANEADLSPVAPFPSSPHAMFRFTGSDEVTFGLSPGETVIRAKVSVNSLYGEAHVTFVGSTDSRSFTFNQGQQPWQSVEVHTTDLGDGGLSIGEIRR